MFTAVVVICSMTVGLCAEVDNPVKYDTKTECVRHLGPMAAMGAGHLRKQSIPGPYGLKTAHCIISIDGPSQGA